MSLELAREFSAYVSIETFPGNADPRRYVLHLRFELEGSWDSDEFTWPWEYSRAQQGSDAAGGAGSYEQRLAEEMDKFRRHVEYELELGGQRIYERTGTDGLVRALQLPKRG